MIGESTHNGIDYDTSSMKLLLVDDDPSTLDILSYYCQEWGYRVELAEDGQSALQKVRSCHPDLIITDIVMPELNGLTLLQRLKEMPSMQTVPVLVVSGDSELEMVSACLEAGAEDYIEKPFVTPLLKSRIQGILFRLHLARLLQKQQCTKLREAVAREVVGGIRHHVSQPLTMAKAHLGILGKYLEQLDGSDDVRQAIDQEVVGLEDALDRLNFTCREIDHVVRPESEGYAGGGTILDLSHSQQHTILVAEDDPAVLRIEVLRLQAKGYKVITAQDGKEAERHLRFSNPHLAIFDCCMPHAENLLKAFQLKQLGETTVPLIVFSALADTPHSPIPPHLLEAADLRIQKGGPESFELLVQQVDELLKRPVLS